MKRLIILSVDVEPSSWAGAVQCCCSAIVSVTSFKMENLCRSCSCVGHTVATYRSGGLTVL